MRCPLPSWLTNRYARLSFRAQLLVQSAAAGFLSVLFMGLMTAWLSGWAGQQSLENKHNMLRPLLSAALTGPMIERNYAVVQEITESIIHSHDIDTIQVVSSAGAIVAQASVANPTAQDYSKALALELTEGGIGFGRVELRLSAAHLAAMEQRLLLSLAVIAIVSMLLAFFMLDRWARRLGGRIERLTVSAHALAAGDYSVRCLDHGPDEVGTLAQDFNVMAAQVARSIDDLAVSESRVSAILDSIGDGLIATDTAMRVSYLNPIAEALTGWTQAEATGLSIAEVFRIENALNGHPAEIPVARVLECGHIVGLANHTVLVARDGRRRHIADSAAPIRDAAGRLVGVVMVFHDVTEAYGLRASLEESRTRLALALQGADLGLWDRNLATNTMVFDQRWAAMLGYRLNELEQSYATWENAVHPDDLAQVLQAQRDHLSGVTPQYEAEYRMRTKKGNWCWILSRGRVSERDGAGQPLRITGTHLDVSARKQAQTEIERLAYFDPLTGLPNRRLLQDRLAQAAAHAQRHQQFGALLFIDLDHFKHINDSRGHAVGDLVLKDVSQRLTSLLRASDTLARMGGDEFVALLSELGSQADVAASMAREVAEKLRSALRANVTVEGTDYHTSASIGIALFPQADHSAADLLRHADTAMYAAKESGRNQVCFFEPAMQAAAELRMALESDLRLAIERQELRLYCQAQMDGAGRVVGAEVLLRWQHPERGLVPPARFIPLAEETGLIVPMGAWVLESAFHLQRRLEDAGLPLRISINVSPRQFAEADFVTMIKTLLRKTNAYAPRLTLEITEGMLLHNIEASITRMNEIKQLGLGFSIDDFGTGYSSLTYLKRLPLRELKIDRGFINGLPRDAEDVALVDAILDVAESFHLEVVAEGVETAEQQNFLQASGCRVFQGYLFGRPQPQETWVAQVLGHDRQSSPQA